MEYRLDNYTRNPEFLTSRLAQNCKARRLEKGYSRRTLSKLTGIPSPTIERFERTGKISLESFCKLLIHFDYFDEARQLLSKTKYSTMDELNVINHNRNRQKGR